MTVVNASGAFANAPHTNSDYLPIYRPEGPSQTDKHGMYGGARQIQALIDIAVASSEVSSYKANQKFSFYCKRSETKDKDIPESGFSLEYKALKGGGGYRLYFKKSAAKVFKVLEGQMDEGNDKWYYLFIK